MCNDRCVDLALEGERRCRSGDPRTGVTYLEAALAAGTDDLRTLSAIYSQLGNAYFYMGDYIKALEYHRHDVTLARTIGDRAGEAKASGNLGNTLKVLAKYDEAVVCCQRHLEISRELNDKLGESRALYNIANVYHAKGKHIGRMSNYEAGEYPQEVRHCLLRAVEYYQQNLKLVQELNDKAAEGRSCGNLGNTYYLLGDFSRAVQFHVQRLNLAKQFGDKPAMRRAYSNLGNAHVFLGEFEQAVECYKQALAIAIELGDSATEAQACYSLGNTASLLGEHDQAIEYHIRHLSIARQLSDRVGQARAAWSLGNAYMSLGQHSKSLYFVMLHMQLSAEIGDTNGESIAEQNLADLSHILGDNHAPDASADPSPIDLDKSLIAGRRSRRRSFDRLQSTPCCSSSNKLSPAFSNNRFTSADGNSLISQDGEIRRNSTLSVNHVQPTFVGALEDLADDDTFFDYLSRAQSKRMDDQRCDPKALVDNKENRPRIRASDAPRVGNVESPCCSNLSRTSRSSSKSTNNLSNLWRKSLLSLRSTTIGSRRYRHDSLWSLNRYSMKKNKQKFGRVAKTIEFDENSIDSKNADDRKISACSENDSSLIREQGPEEFLDLVIGIQSRRMDDQRALLPELPGLQHPAQVLGPHLLIAAQQRQKEQQQQQNGTATNTNTNNINGNSALPNNSTNLSSKPATESLSATKNIQVMESVVKCDKNHQLDDDFIEMLMRCQSTRIDEQRSELPDRSKGITVPDDDFFQLVLKIQARRFEEQRANLVKGQPSNDK